MASSKYSSTSFRAFGSEGISESEAALAQKVSEYRISDWTKESRATYSEIKETFSKDVKKKDQRFILSELVAGQMSVEEEDQRRFDQKLEQELSKAILSIKAQAHDEGYAQGLKEGVDKAFEEEKARIAARLESMASVVNEIVKSKENLESDYEKKLTEYAFQIAEIIVESEIKNRPESVTSVVKNILDLMSKEDDVKVYVGVENKGNIGYLNEEISKISRKATVSIEVRDDLKLGDVVVESFNGEVSARLDERIQSFRNELMNKVSQTEAKKAV